MPAYFVHGVPDSPAIWEPILRVLARRDVVTPTLPGFGTPSPPVSRRRATSMPSG